MSIEVEAQPVPQETTKSHKKHAKGASRVKHRQREGTEPSKGTVRERKRASPAEERTTDRDLGAPSPATVPTIPHRSRDTGGEMLGKERKAKADEQRSPQRGALRGAKQSASRLSARGESKRERALSPPYPTHPPLRLSLCPLVFLGRLLVSPLPPDRPPRTDPK